MSAALKPYTTPEEYLELERRAEFKSEYFAGEVFAMAGGSPDHSLIAANMTRELGAQLLEKPCRVYNSDLRVHASELLYTYPDVTVICGDPEFSDEHGDTLLNPTVIVEVLSPYLSPSPSPARGGESVSPFPRREGGQGVRFEHYRQQESLQEYVLIAQDRAHVERFARQPDGQWLLSEVNGLERAMALRSIACDLALSQVYHKVEFSEAGGRRPER